MEAFVSEFGPMCMDGQKTIYCFLFYVQHAADEKFNFEHLARSTVMNQQPLLQ